VCGVSLTSSLDPGNSRRNALSSVVSCQIRTLPSRYPDWLPEEVLDSIGELLESQAFREKFGYPAPQNWF
jgi:hypothetical protein